MWVYLFALMAKFVYIKIHVILIFKLELQLFQMNVKTPFLIVGLKETIYMEQLESFIEKNQENFTVEGFIQLEGFIKVYLLKNLLRIILPGESHFTKIRILL